MSTMTLNLSDKETQALEQLCKSKDMNKTNVLRAALRLYQHVYFRLQKGEEMAFVDKDGKVIKQIIFGCGGHD